MINPVRRRWIPLKISQLMATDYKSDSALCLPLVAEAGLAALLAAVYLPLVTAQGRAGLQHKRGYMKNQQLCMKIHP